jgi:hypothetical protein
MQTFYGQTGGAAEPPKQNFSLWRESWNNIGETKSVGNKLYYK